MGLPVFVRLSEGNYVNVDQIQLTRKGKQNGNIIQLVGMPHPLTVSDDAEFSILCKALDALQATVPKYIDSAANVTSSPGLQSKSHQEAGQYPAGSDQSFAEWAASLGMYVPVRRAYESDLALVNVAGRMLRVTEDPETPGLIDVTEQVADGQKVVITSMKRDDFTAWMLSQLQGTFCFYGHPMHFGKPSGSNGAMNG